MSELASILEAQVETLMQRWMARVRRDHRLPDAPEPQLRDDLPEVLAALARSLREDVSQGLAHLAQMHGRQRRRLGFDVDVVVREYRMLRDCLNARLDELAVPVTRAEERAIADYFFDAVAISVEEHRRQALETNAERELRLRTVMDALPVLVSFVTGDERYGLVNRAYEDWFGVPQESLLGRTVREVIGEAAYAVLGPHVQRGLAGEHFTFEQLGVPYRLGGKRDVRVTFTPYRTPGGEQNGYVALLQDITEARALARQRDELLAREAQARADVEVARVRLESLFENAPAVMAMIQGPEHVFTVANAPYRRLVGEGRELIGLRVVDALPEVAAQGFIALLDGVYRTGQPFIGKETPIQFDRTGGGTPEEAYLNFAYLASRDASGQVVGIDAFGFDVTEQVQARQRLQTLADQLRDSEERLRSVVEAAGVGLWEADVPTGAFTADARSRAMLGLPAVGELTFDTVITALPLEADRERLRSALPIGLDREGRFGLQLRTRGTGAGDHRWVELRARAQFDARGAPARMAGLMMDVTSSKDAEAERETFLASVAEQPVFGVAFLMGPSFVFEHVNAAYRQVVGGRDVVGKPLVDALPDLRGQGFDVLLREVLSTGRPFVGREVPTHLDRGADGPPGISYFDFVYQPVFDVHGVPTGIIAISHDVTAGVLARLESERLAKEAEARADFEQQLIGIVSHDLRNPLSAIRLTTTALGRQPTLDPQTAQRVLRIQSSADRALRMVKDLLDFTQARLGVGIPLQPREVDLAEVVLGAIEELRAGYPERELHFLAPHRLMGAWDADRIAQVVSNLATNALKYGAPEQPIEVRMVEEPELLRIEVHNQGSPIPEALRERIFEPMQRGAAQPDATSRSVGLGLYIVKAVVEAHGGSVSVTSTAEQGTTFSVRLPRARGA